MNREMRALVDAVRKHACKHYEEDGWDYVVESYDDEELSDLIADAKTVEDAIANVKEIVSIINDQREDAQGEAF